MRWSDLFTLSNHITSNTEEAVSGGSRAQDAARIAQVNKQIHSLIPGQTIQGEIIAKEGGEVSVRIQQDLVLNARLEKNINLEVGKSVTFEVKNNGSALTLSPLFANTATDATVLKALDMAALPVNQNTLAMTRMMMGAGLPVDRNHLQQVFRETNLFPEQSLEHIIDLHKLGMEVTPENLTQLESYKNLTHQLVAGMNNVLEELPFIVEDLAAKQDAEGMKQLLQGLLHMTGELSADMETADIPMDKGQVQELLGKLITVGLASEGMADGAGLQKLMEGLLRNPMQGENVAEAVLNLTDGLAGGEQLKTAMQSLLEGSVADDGTVAQDGAVKDADTAQNPVLENGISISEDGKMIQVHNSGLNRILSQILGTPSEQNTYSAQDILKGVQQLLGRSAGDSVMAELLQDKTLGKLLTDTLKNGWTIEPEEVQDKGKVEELYQRIHKQLNRLAEVLEQTGQSAANALKGTQNLTQNLDFLQQLNQMYTYVQLPLKLQESTAHGELYIYTNKKHLAAADGNVSALLHLDMEHLGPVDVYVAMQKQKVNTRFYVADDEMLDFLGAHMDILNKRLEQRGYQMNCEMQLRNGEKEEKESVIQTILQENAGSVPLAQYAFDVRA